MTHTNLYLTSYQYCCNGVLLYVREICTNIIDYMSRK
jgi:hypothetical protein